MENVLKDVILIVGDIEETSQGNTYPTSQIYRFDFEGNTKEFIEHVGAHKGIVHADGMLTAETGV